MANRSHNWRCDKLRHSFLPPHSSSKYLISLPAYPSSCGIPNAMRDTPPPGYTPRSTARYGSGVAVARSVTWSDRNRSLEGSGEYTQKWVALSHRSAPMTKANVMENRRAVILPRNASSATAAMTARATALLSAPHAICASVARAAAARAPRSEEHTSELQSRLHLVCRLLLEKKKKDIKQHMTQ